MIYLLGRICCLFGFHSAVGLGFYEYEYGLTHFSRCEFCHVDLVKNCLTGEGWMPVKHVLPNYYGED